jgi:hypothetical protein
MPEYLKIKGKTIEKNKIPKCAGQQLSICISIFFFF